MDSAFTAKFRLIPNKKRKSGNDCDQADACETPGGSTIRKYSSRTDYEEIAGFTMFGSQWSVNPDSEEEWEDGRGTIAPRA